MEILTSTNWLVEHGSLHTLPRLSSLHLPNAASSSSSSSSCPQIRLRRPEAVGSCTLQLKRQHHTEQQQVYHQLILVSNAKLCELSVQRLGDSSASYVSTTRAQPMASGQFYKAEINLQPVAGWHRLEVKLLSLQGGKDACTICNLVLLTPQRDSHHAPATGSEPPEEAAHSGPAQAGMSQLDELRLLNDSVQKLAAAEGSSSVPQSLQLLFSKASQQPAGSAAAVKSLSSMVAQGMLQKHSAVCQQLMHQQQSWADTQLVQVQAPPQQQSRPAVQQQQQQPAIAIGGTTNSEPGQSQLTPACNTASSSSSTISDHQAVILAVQRLDSKLDDVAAKLLAAVDRISQQQQHICGRLAAIEQCMQQEGLPQQRM